MHALLTIQLITELVVKGFWKCVVSVVCTGNFKSIVLKSRRESALLVGSLN